MRALILPLVLLLAPDGAAWAHGGAPDGEVASWTFDPWIVTPLLTSGLLYAAGSVRLARRVHRLNSVRAGAFWTGWLTLAATLTSPLHWLGEHLFTFHMIEHEILMAISAPLIVASRPLGTMLWALPRGVRRWSGRTLNLPMLRSAWSWLVRGGNATLLHGVAIWVWHVPVLFDAAVDQVALHRLQHLSFFGTAVLFWWAVLWRSQAGAAAWHVVITMLHTSVLGALMALAPRVLYSAQTASSAAWGLTPLEDQQLAGLIMWVPAGTIYAGAALVLIVLWIKSSSEKARPSDVLHAV
ncbi:Membrane protein-like protein precursor [Bradyrhizobium sp. ORS 375]|uniref:cytochrome c oxidase assembly protein n=1 Tax=Bradyrhizobium sp. (strain ORS 375) TaxID=566679 RepID=UPI00024058B1|nr:cytochrome c oxidase assembly protein [Bradyrhizobium sp. ORS 375]CCD94274.1 Membrane protein-like protein precursor [Bradyrhizobium sp. ORS 375]